MIEFAKNVPLWNEPRTIYLDAAATTTPNPEVIEDIYAYMRSAWQNPSAIYEPARTVRRNIEIARDKVRTFLQTDSKDKIIFTSCGSESNNLAIKGFAKRNEDVVVITNQMQHPSIYNISKNSSSFFEVGSLYDVIYCDVDKTGATDLEDLEEICRSITGGFKILVAVSMVNNEIGVIENIPHIANIVHKYNGVLLVDACQAIYHRKIAWQSLDIDMLTFTSEKIGMPRGVGVLYVRDGIELSPEINGGHQEYGLRAGTENSAMIMALGNQLERISDNVFDWQVKEEELHKCMVDEIHNACRDVCSVSINGSDKEWTASNILSVTFKGIDNQALLTLLGENGIYCSTGSACNAGETELSRVLLEIWLTTKEIRSTLRFSFEHTNTIGEIKEFGKVLKKCLVMLKSE